MSLAPSARTPFISSICALSQGACGNLYQWKAMTEARMERGFLSMVRRIACDTRSDADLLVLMRDDHAAFAELVARHGPLVWVSVAICLEKRTPRTHSRPRFLPCFGRLYGTKTLSLRGFMGWRCEYHSQAAGRPDAAGPGSGTQQSLSSHRLPNRMTGRTR
jgi:hypothetical protein